MGSLIRCSFILAEWQSGYAAVCKTVDLGSIPGSASKSNSQFCVCPGGGIGRRKGLKIPRLNRRAGSIPAPGTICDLSNIFYLKLIKVSKTIASFIVKPVHISDKIPLEFLHITGDI